MSSDCSSSLMAFFWAAVLRVGVFLTFLVGLSPSASREVSSSSEAFLVRFLGVFFSPAAAAELQLVSGQ